MTEREIREMILSAIADVPEVAKAVTVDSMYKVANTAVAYAKDKELIKEG